MASLQDRRESEPHKNFKKPWRVRWRDRQGRQLTQSFESKLDARIFALEVEERELLGQQTDSRVHMRKLKVSEVLDLYLDSPRSMKSRNAAPSKGYVALVKGHGKRIRDVLGSAPIIDVCLREEPLRKFEAKLKADGLAPSTMNRHLSTLQMLATYAIREGLLPRDTIPPRFQKFTEKKPTTGGQEAALTRKQLQAVIDKAPEEHRAFMLLAVRTGARFGELCALKRSDLKGKKDKRHVVIERAREHDTVDQFKSTKTGTARSIPVDEETWADLKAHIIATAENRSKRPDLDLLFPTRSGTMFSKSTFTRRVWKPVKEKAKLPEGVTFQHLRRSFGSHLYAETRDAVITATVMGHSNIAMTLNRYARPVHERQEDIIAAMARVKGGSA